MTVFQPPISPSPRSPRFPYIFLPGGALQFSATSYGDPTMPILEQDFESTHYPSFEDLNDIFYLSIDPRNNSDFDV